MSLNRERLILILPPLLLAVLSTLHLLFGYSYNNLLSESAIGLDDAFITYRYSENLWNGLGPVFNGGERPVEGYSNFLYMVLMAPAFAFADGTTIYYISASLNILFTALALLLFSRFLIQELGLLKGTVGTILLLFYPSLIALPATGLETSLVLLVQILIWISVEGVVKDRTFSYYLLGLSIIVSILLRADGFIPPIVAILYLGIKSRWRPFVSFSLLTVTVIALYFSWRYLYYGYPLPNTYYAKVSGTIGERMANAFMILKWLAANQGLFIYMGGLVIAAIIALLNILKVKALNKDALWGLDFPIVFSGAIFCYYIYIGGDYFIERFLIITVPMGIFLILRILPDRLHLFIWFLLLSSVLYFQSGPFFTDGRFRYVERSERYDCWVELGRFLKDRYPPEEGPLTGSPPAQATMTQTTPAPTTIAIDAAGKVPYMTGFRTIDMLGLNDAHIGHMESSKFVVAHSKFDSDYILAARPKLIAAWIDTNLNMKWGLPESKYKDSGYSLKYIVYSKRRLEGTAIVDITSFERERVQALVSLGYNYGVLERTAPLPH